MVRAMCVYTHPHVSDKCFLVVVESRLFSILTMMIYTHPVCNFHSISYIFTPSSHVLCKGYTIDCYKLDLRGRYYELNLDIFNIDCLQ